MISLISLSECATQQWQSSGCEKKVRETVAIRADTKCYLISSEKWKYKNDKKKTIRKNIIFLRKKGRESSCFRGDVGVAIVLMDGISHFNLLSLFADVISIEFKCFQSSCRKFISKNSCFKAKFVSRAASLRIFNLFCFYTSIIQFDKGQQYRFN